MDARFLLLVKENSSADPVGVNELASKDKSININCTRTSPVSVASRVETAESALSHLVCDYMRLPLLASRAIILKVYLNHFKEIPFYKVDKSKLQ